MTSRQWNEERMAVRARMKELLARPLRQGIRNDAWTPTQVFHHVLLVNAATIQLLTRLLEKTQAASVPEPGDPWPIRRFSVAEYEARAFAVPAFRGTEPRADIGSGELAALEAEEDKLQELATRADSMDYSALTFPHPLAGRLNYYEWLVFGILHEQLHVDRLEEDV